MTPLTLQIKRLHPKAVLPKRGTPGAACYDLTAVETLTIPPSTIDANGQVQIGFAAVPTGLALAIPDGYMGRIGARSGLSFKHNLEVGAGFIDADYRGEVKVKLMNCSSFPFIIHQGDRVAQIAIVPVLMPAVVEVEALPMTERNTGGFGSTGLTTTS